MKKWSVAEAKARLSELLDRARKQPQVIENRGRPTAVVLSVEEYGRMKALDEQTRPTAMEELLGRCAELRSRADLDLELGPRTLEPDRGGAFETP